MLKLYLTFIVFAVAIGFAVKILREMTGRERWHLTKLLVFSTLCSLAALVVMMLIVVLF